MGQLLLLVVVALTVAAVVFGVTVLVTGQDPGLAPAEPDGRAVPLPGTRPLRESDVGEVRFDTALRGYRMAQVDQAMRRAAYDIGYKSELIGVLEAEVTALREGRTADAEALRRAREQAADATAPQEPATPVEAGTDTGSTSSSVDPEAVAPVGDEPSAGQPLDDEPAAGKHGTVVRSESA
ncbi:DivIVA domain-containing protein [Micromonospora sp. GCM10011542]|uniref:DivIVA domain-containing protein n=1 Tax=Micromonospora sp. GCM10011542 TaxID=3317337 RepID=UPI003622CFCD